MAVTSKTVTNTSNVNDLALVSTWAAIPNGNTGEPFEWPGFADRSVQITGTFGGGTVVIEGSNDGTNYVTLNNMQGSALSFSAAGFKGVAEISRYIRPSVSGGDGTTAITVTIVARRASR